jgi:hypothetical protein
MKRIDAVMFVTTAAAESESLQWQATVPESVNVPNPGAGMNSQL